MLRMVRWFYSDDAGGAGGGAAGGEAAGGAEKGPTMIPIDRLNKEIAEKRALAARVAELEAVAKGAGDWQAKATSYQRELALTRAGITDPDAVEVLQLFYEKLPKDGRPSLEEWARTMKEKPETAPAVLRSIFGGSGAAGGGAAGGAGAAGGGAAGAAARLGGANAGGAQPPTAKGAFTPEQIAAMSIEEYRQNRSAILAQQSRGGRSI